MKRWLNAALLPLAARAHRFEPFWRWLIRPDSTMYPDFVRRRYGAHVGQATTINPESKFYEGDHGAVWIGDDCAISGAEFMTHCIVDRQLERRGYDTPRLQRIVVLDGVAIGMGARIKSPCTIGRGSIIGAGAFVSKDVAPDSIVVGANRVLAMKASAYRSSRITGTSRVERAITLDATLRGDWGRT